MIALDYLEGIKFSKMKKIRNHLRICSCILIIAILCQSCVVYHKTPTLEQAVQENTKTKILLEDGRVEKFKAIIRKDQHYFGMRKTGFDQVSIPINVNAVSEVRVKNEKASGVFTAVTVIVGLGTLVWIGASSFSVDAGGDAF